MKDPLSKPTYMSAADVRSAFLEFFRDHDHIVVPSSSLVPGNDPTLLFTNAGMVQFKDVFLGKDQRDYLRAATSQRCVRAGGKHNDLENVGYTARHHTFFEMLGNFSFGDYFKRDAIRFAWDFLIGNLRLDPKRLWCTVYRDDDEAADIWLKDIGIARERFSRLGEASNFWAMGDTGPCGPCSEIFYDHGPHIPGGPPGSPDEDGDRYVEIWNLVFMQFERWRRRQADAAAEALGRYRHGPGAHHGGDAGRALQLRHRPVQEPDPPRRQARRHHRCSASSSLRVIADHIRACTFLVVDGVLPSNEGRGYVLRRIIRRAIRHGYKLGIQEPFFYKLVPVLEAEMGEAYPELQRGRAHAERVLKQEEERFAETLANGMVLLEGAIRTLRGAKVIDGDTVFKLYDTYGFPVDLTADIARERGLSIDQAALRGGDGGAATPLPGGEQVRRGHARRGDHRRAHAVPGLRAPERQGRVVALLHDGEAVESLAAGEEGEVVLDRTPFYAESGGQVGDAGELSATGVRFTVADTQKRGAAHSHLRQAHRGALRVGRRARWRRSMARAARQPRSITPPPICCTRRCARCWAPTCSRRARWWPPIACALTSRTSRPLTPGELREIERLVNAQIRANAAERDARDGLRRGRGRRRHGAVRREVRQGRARAAHGGLLHGAVRRHARAARRRHRPVQDRERERRGLRRAPHRGDDRRGRAATTSSRTTSW